jgi:glycosyltransferase involved in cell wall biosynthesis
MVGKGVPSEKITYIPYGTDIDMFNPKIDGSSIRRELNLEDKFLVVYAGALGQANDIYTLLDAARRLREYPDIKIVLFGDGKERENLENEAARLELDNVIFAGVRPKKEMPSILACSDVCLAILQDIPMFRTTYPNKVFDYMAAGRGTVLVIDGVVRGVIEAARGGIFVTPGDGAALAETILHLSKNPDLVKKMGVNAREYLVAHLDRRDKMAETLVLMEKLTE